MTHALVRCSAWSGRAAIDDELKKIVVGISRVDAAADGGAMVPATNAFNGALLDSCANLSKLGQDVFDCTGPHEAEVAAAGPGSVATQGEAWVLPDRGGMDIDLVLTQLNREEQLLGSAPLLKRGCREAERTIELEASVPAWQSE